MFGIFHNSCCLCGGSFEQVVQAKEAPAYCQSCFSKVRAATEAAVGNDIR